MKYKTSHIDEEWIKNKIDGHGGSFQYDDYNSLAQIGYIGSTSTLKIIYYNIILWFKFISRKINKLRRSEVNE